MTETVEDRHKLGWGLAALVVAGNMIGSGVYLLPATLAPVGSSSVIGWGVAGLGAVTLALVFAALGRLQPDADGLSVSPNGGWGGSSASRQRWPSGPPAWSAMSPLRSRRRATSASSFPC